MEGLLLAKAITKQHAKTFYFASRFLKKEKRFSAYAVYAICRISDEAVDSKQDSSALDNLAILQQKIDSAYKNAPLADSLLLAFQQSINKYHIPKKYFDALIKGMHMDLYKNRYKNFEELYDYCYKVAGVVGLAMLEIFGYTDPKATDYAISLGVAMQLTNILRDIKEDFNRNRIYLPGDEMQRFQVSESDISRSQINENFKALMKFQIARSREYYEKAKQGIKMLDDLNSRFVVCAMADIYSGILNSIEKNDFDVFTRRACVSIPRKIIAVLNIIFKGEYL